jgi:hypothetical protein
MDVFRAVRPPRSEQPSAGGHPYRASPAGADGPRVVVARRLLALDDQPAGIAEYVDRLIRLRIALGPDHCPRVLLVDAVDGMNVACLEEDAGDVSFRSLLERLREPLPLAVALHVARAVVSAWRALETLGGTPDAFVDACGVRLGWDGRVRLLACPTNRPRAESDPTIVQRTPKGLPWFAPEALRGTPRPESMMFAVGMLLFEALTGRHPFLAGSDLELLHGILEVELPDTRVAMPRVPVGVAALVKRCADKRPNHRFASWAALQVALEHAIRAAAPFGDDELRKLLERAFPEERARAGQRETDAQRLVMLSDPYGAEDTVTVPMKSRPRLRVVPSVDAGEALDGRPEVHGPDDRPMLRVSRTLLVDLRPVSCAEYAHYLAATNQRAAPLAAPPPPERAALPVTGVTLDDAYGYARWAQKRIPADDEWDLAARIAGEGVLDVGAVWELTTGEHDGEDDGDGWLVRGGPWRDRVGDRGRAENLSHSDAAPDVGFRCVADAPAHG